MSSVLDKVEISIIKINMERKGLEIILEKLVTQYQKRVTEEGLSSRPLKCRDGVFPGEEISCSKAFLDDFLNRRGPFIIRLLREIGDHTERCNRRNEIAAGRRTGRIIPVINALFGLFIALGMPFSILEPWCSHSRAGACCWLQKIESDPPEYHGCCY